MAETQQQAPLEDLMAAMDVVDTLRHQQDIAERELDTEGRRARLLERLKKLYQGQGIEVPDHVLAEGIEALEQERFQYKPVPATWKTRLAHIWVSRGRWGKPISFLAVLGGLFYGVYFATDVYPQQRLKASLPDQVQSTLLGIIKVAKNPQIVEDAQQTAARANRAIGNGELQQAQSMLGNMESVLEQLEQTYTIRVVSQPGQQSGIWRRPPNNSTARNYYLIVEAIDSNNQVVELTVLNEESNRATRKKTWGLRVNEATFNKVASDKRDDGIIQGNRVGEKKVGYLKPEFSIPTTGATITEW